MVVSVSLDHPITPRLGTTRRPDGEVASLLLIKDYPVMAECLECGMPVRTDAYGADWYHVTRPVPSGMGGVPAETT